MPASIELWVYRTMTRELLTMARVVLQSTGCGCRWLPVGNSTGTGLPVGWFPAANLSDWKCCRPRLSWLWLGRCWIWTLCSEMYDILVTVLVTVWVFIHKGTVHSEEQYKCTYCIYTCKYTRLYPALITNNGSTGSHAAGRFKKSLCWFRLW